MVYHQDYKLYLYEKDDIAFNQNIGERFIYDKNNINSKIELNLIIRMLDNQFQKFEDVIKDCLIWCGFSEEFNTFNCYYAFHETYKIYDVYRLYEKEVLVGYYFTEIKI